MIYYCHPLGFYIRPNVLGVTLLQQIFCKPSQYTSIRIGVDKTIWSVFSLCGCSRCTCRSPFLSIAEYFCNYFCFFVSSLRWLYLIDSRISITTECFFDLRDPIVTSVARTRGVWNGSFFLPMPAKFTTSCICEKCILF